MFEGLIIFVSTSSPPGAGAPAFGWGIRSLFLTWWVFGISYHEASLSLSLSGIYFLCFSVLYPG